jgi:hypothetical protein
MSCHLKIAIDHEYFFTSADYINFMILTVITLTVCLYTPTFYYYYYLQFIATVLLSAGSKYVAYSQFFLTSMYYWGLMRC